MIRTGKAGSGTYGIVYNGETSGDKKRRVAVKRNIVDESVSFSGSIKELDLLNRLKGHPYIVKLLTVSFTNPFISPNSPIGKIGNYNYREDYLHFIFEQANNNGHSLIYTKGIPICYLKLAMTQMFLGIEYMHSQGVIHRDLKPANLLWFITADNKAAIKLCDFGLAKVHTPHGPMTPRVVTSWYRAPEICVKDTQYGYPSDIWSAGCILFEMVSKKALLINSVDDDIKLLSKIIGLIPEPPYDEIYKLTKGHKITLTAEASPRQRATFKQLINLPDEGIEDFNSLPQDGATYDQFLDLIKHILVLDPDKRYNATEILDHNFFNPYREIITWCRKSYPPIPPPLDNVNIICCRERAWACKVAFLIFNGRGYLKWYTHRILFQSIDMFDRYLSYIETNITTKLIESKLQGKYLTRYHTELHYIVCLYMCIKYFTTLHIPISFTELATDDYKTEKAMLEAEEFEKKMLKDILQLKIHRNTVYDIASDINGCSLDEYQTCDLLDRYGNIRNHYTNVSLNNLYISLIQNDNK
jgi:serine/threonine protein kinase